jgi:UDP-N-acetylmuramyl-tripeptide synthetase
MRLSEILAEQAPELSCAAAALQIDAVTDDSRQVRPGTLFFALRGLTVDGANFAANAVRAGACAVVSERPLALAVPCVVVDNAPRALGLAAARLAGRPAEHLTCIGVTGTNGKTTTTYLIESILGAAGLRPGVIGTVSYRYAGTATPAPFTTPTPVALQRLLGEMVTAGCTHLAMEVSSHALALGRLWGCAFGVAAFSNLSQDHLDLHGDMASYARAKARLFGELLQPGGVAVINLDGDGAEQMLAAARARGDVRVMRCSRSRAEAEARLEVTAFDLDGLRGTLVLDGVAQDVRTPLLGAFNADNALLAAACCHAAGVPLATIARGLERPAPVPGRLQRIAPPAPQTGPQPTVVVDYAHTPDALARAIDVLRPLCRGRLVVVFGCGGDRDRAKRPLMAQAAARGADVVVVTTDNPRSEDPAAIIDEILVGLHGEALPPTADLRASRGYAVQPDRRAAIRAAIGAATAADLVLVAGKGHEDYQIIGTQRLHFDDREEARAALAARAAGHPGAAR